MEIFLYVAGIVFAVVGAVSFARAIPLAPFALILGGVLLLGVGEILSRIGKGR